MFRAQTHANNEKVFSEPDGSTVRIRACSSLFIETPFRELSNLLHSASFENQNLNIFISRLPLLLLLYGRNRALLLLLINVNQSI